MTTDHNDPISRLCRKSLDGTPQKVPGEYFVNETDSTEAKRALLLAITRAEVAKARATIGAMRMQRI